MTDCDYITFYASSGPYQNPSIIMKRGWQSKSFIAFVGFVLLFSKRFVIMTTILLVLGPYLRSVYNGWFWWYELLLQHLFKPSFKSRRDITCTLVLSIFLKDKSWWKGVQLDKLKRTSASFDRNMKTNMSLLIRSISSAMHERLTITDWARGETLIGIYAHVIPA